MSDTEYTERGQGAYKPEAWRMRGYYPGSYAKSMSALDSCFDYNDADYDRYEAEFLADLDAHDAELLAQVRASILDLIQGPPAAEYDQAITDALAVVDRLSPQP